MICICAYSFFAVLSALVLVAVLLLGEVVAVVFLSVLDLLDVLEPPGLDEPEELDFL